jgi:hypothetical protein
LGDEQVAFLKSQFTVSNKVGYYFEPFELCLK